MVRVMTTGASDIIDVAATLAHETPKAFLVDAGMKEKIWLPKSQVEKNDDGTFAMPEWLAKEKGLI